MGSIITDTFFLTVLAVKILIGKHLKGKSLNSQRKKAGAESKRMMSARFWNGKQIDEILAFSLLLSVQGEKEASSAETPS